MSAIVILHVSFRVERLVAAFYRAPELLDFSMNSHMDDHVLLVAKLLATEREWTGEGLGIVVLVHVTRQTSPRGEYFRTVFFWADKWESVHVGAPFGIFSLAQDAVDLWRYIFITVALVVVLSLVILRLGRCLIRQVLCVKHPCI